MEPNSPISRSWGAFILKTALLFLFICAGTAAAVRVDAAFGNMEKNQVYLIRSNQYVVLEDTVESRRGPITDLGLPADATVKAAVRNANTGVVTYFYTENGQYKSMGISGPLPEFISQDIDAAARKFAQEFYFKGCEYILRWARINRWFRNTHDVRKYNLPCSPDAAWSEKGGAIIVLKDDKVWRWGRARNATDPVNFSKVYTLTDSLE